MEFMRESFDLILYRYLDRHMEGEESHHSLEDHSAAANAEVPHCLLEGLLCDPQDVPGWTP